MGIASQAEGIAKLKRHFKGESTQKINKSNILAINQERRYKKMRSFNLSLLSLLVLAVFTSSALAASAKQCRALVLSAGGDLGSFEAGAVKAIVNIVNA